MSMSNKNYIEFLCSERNEIKQKMQDKQQKLMNSTDEDVKAELTQDIIKFNKKQSAIKFHINTLYGTLSQSC